VDGKAKYRVVKAILQACERIGAPPLDERLKSIVASMIGNCLKGGYPEDHIRRVGVELVDKYTRFHGHESMLALQRIVIQRDDDDRMKAHEAQLVQERGPLDPRVAALLGPVMKRDPRRLPGNHRPQGDPCAICQGPPGVHVKLTNVPELEREAMEEFQRERDLRRRMRMIGE
jgi:hypothetical protein